MKNKKLDELEQQPTPQISEEEKIAILDEIIEGSKARLDQMKKENPDVVDWIKNGKPKL